MGSRQSLAPVASDSGAASAAVSLGVGARGAHADPRLLLVGLYYRAVAFLQSTVGVVLRRDMTLREYLSAVAGRIPAALRSFTKLTRLAERALYGRREPGRGDVSDARELLETISPERQSRELDDREELR